MVIKIIILTRQTGNVLDKQKQEQIMAFSVCPVSIVILMTIICSWFCLSKTFPVCLVSIIILVTIIFSLFLLI
jgi:hypothetical protein